MEDLKDFEEVVEFLDKIPQFLNVKQGLEYGKDRAQEILKLLGRPEKDLKIIHVAGTNGKGSVCAYLSACLESVGLKTGSFTSPHLTDIRERIRIGKSMIGRDDFVRLFNKVRRKVSQAGIEIAYFEYFLHIALLYYKEQGTDCVILETGLGGRLDATNAVTGKILSVITGIGLEHTEILGDSLEEIAKEKAGIIAPGVPVVVSCNNNHILKIFKKCAEENGSRLIYADYAEITDVSITPEKIDFSLENEYYKNVSFTVPAPALYEAVNAKTALTAAAYLKESSQFDGFNGEIDDDDIDAFKAALKGAVWEGRMERIAPGIYVDGAHNPQGAEVFTESVKAFAGDKRNTLLCSIVSDKDYEEMIRIMTKDDLFEEFVIAVASTDRALSKEELMRAFKEHTNAQVHAFRSASDAFEYAEKNFKDYLFCVGSLYLAGDIKRLKGKKDA